MAAARFKKTLVPTRLLLEGEQAEPPPPPPPPPRTPFRRAAAILWFAFLLSLRELLRWILRRPSARPLAAARKARRFAERMGGRFVALARLAALRSDLLGAEFCRELAGTRDYAVPLPFPVIREIVRGELQQLGLLTDQVFSEISETPLATLSFGQFHRARLKKDEREVVIRLRSPAAVERADLDWRYLRLFLFIAKKMNLAPALRWDDLLFEIKKTGDELLDFRSQVSELDRVRKLLKKRKVYVPRVFQRLCTEQMMVSEYLEGTRASEVLRMARLDRERCARWMRENKLDRRQIARRLFDIQHELLFEQNLFFTELSPANILLLRGNRIAFVSMNCGTLEANHHRRYQKLHEALQKGDYGKVCDTYLAMGPALPYVDITNMRLAAVRFLRKWESRTHVKRCPYSEKSLTAALQVLTRCASASKLPAFWTLARLQRANTIFDQTVGAFAPATRSLQSLERYQRAAQLRTLKRAAARGLSKRVDATVDAVRLGHQLVENAQEDSDYLRRRLLGARVKVGRAAQVFGRMCLLLGTLTMAGIVLQLYLYLKNRYNVTLSLAERGGMATALDTVRIQNRVTLAAVVLGLIYLRHKLKWLARRLFDSEVSPSEVS